MGCFDDTIPRHRSPARFVAKSRETFVITKLMFRRRHHSCPSILHSLQPRVYSMNLCGHGIAYCKQDLLRPEIIKMTYASLHDAVHARARQTHHHDHQIRVERNRLQRRESALPRQSISLTRWT